jgi:hypothetical protein
MNNGMAGNRLRDGDYATAFPKTARLVSAGKFLGMLGKFIEPSLLRESLVNTTISTNTGPMEDSEMQAMLLDSVQTDARLGQELAMVHDKSVRHAMIRKKVAKDIRF